MFLFHESEVMSNLLSLRRVKRSNSFIEMRLCNTSRLFKVNNVREHSAHSNLVQPLLLFQNHSPHPPNQNQPISSPQPLSTHLSSATNVFPVPVGSPVENIPCQWNHTLSGLLCVAFVTQPHAFKVRPWCSLSALHSSLQLSDVPL